MPVRLRVDSIDRLLGAVGKSRALVVGDCMLDRYIEGEARRLSPEAPVAVVAVARRSASLGGAANVAAGLSALGVGTTLAGLVGDDQAGRELTGLARPANIVLRIEIGRAATVTKTRVLAAGRHQLLRLDEDGDRAVRESDAAASRASWCERIDDFDVVILSDYDKGTLPAESIGRLLSAARTRGVPTIVDPKKPEFEVYAGATVLTPNRQELERAAGRIFQEMTALAEAMPALCKRWGVEYLLCTCGAEGMVLSDGVRSKFIAAEAREVADVTGAGDTVTAILAAVVAAGGDVETGAAAAALGAGLAVSRPGVHVVDRAELACVCRGLSAKVCGRDQAAARRAEWRRLGLKCVLTNGCFDVLHAGHLECLESARRLGDRLIVAVNSDASVRRLKGLNRPRIDHEHRMNLLAGLGCVDMVVGFGEDTPEALLEELRPDLLVKGGDYELAEVVGADIVRNYGGEVVVLPYVAGLSTSRILAANDSEPSSTDGDRSSSR
jgi:D-beta-D-heptose 7-phosphate kinase/D-beta-D-heptose 1-phosphate adenosyltransferase